MESKSWCQKVSPTCSVQCFLKCRHNCPGTKPLLHLGSDPLPANDCKMSPAMSGQPKWSHVIQTKFQNQTHVQSRFKVKTVINSFHSTNVEPLIPRICTLPSLTSEVTCSKSLLGNNWCCSCRLSSANLIELYLSSVCQSGDCWSESD